VAYWYGGHGAGTCGVSGTINSRSLIAGQGYWIDYMQEEWGGGQLAQMCINIPGVGWTIVDATNANFTNRIFARKYTTPEPVLNPQESVAVSLKVNSSSTATEGSYKFNLTVSSATGSSSAEGEYKIKFACPPGMCSAENICILAGECWGYQQICYPDGQIKNSCGDGKCNCGEDEKTCEADCVGIYFKLFRGWNLISLPYKKITSISGDTCKADQLHFFYYENYSWKKVVGIQNIKGGYSYWTNPEWFTKAFPCYINITTNKNENVTLDDLPKLKKGFNAIGAPATPVKLSELKCLNDAGVSVPIRSVYYWHPYYSQWIQLSSEDELKPEPPYYYGYWIYVDEDCKLTK
jgi:hypothetical protein